MRAGIGVARPCGLEFDADTKNKRFPMSLNSIDGTNRPMVFVGHDASRTGAPIVLLHLLRWLKENTDLRFRIVLMNGGDLAADFAALAPTITLNEVGVGRTGLVRRIGKTPLLGPCLKGLWHHIVTPRVVEQRPKLVYANTVATARLLRQVVAPGVPLIVHVHELERAIQIAAGSEGMASIKSLARRYVAASPPVRDNLIARHGVDQSLIETVPSFIAVDESIVKQSEARRQEMRRSLGIPVNALVVGGCGATGSRKGVDLFVEMARAISAQRVGDPVHFVWVGRLNEDDFTRSVLASVRQWGLAHVSHFVGEHHRPVELFCGCDVFALSSREEPMGLVALEAAMVGKPIVCFAEAGGMPDFVRNECGRTVSPMTGGALAQAVIEILSSFELRASLGRRAFEKVRRTHNIDLVAPRILKVIKDVLESENASPEMARASS
jgi:glycosyltransferase involved in cell wall biosynthesis